MYELELFAGAGGGILAQQLLGHLTVGAVEITPYCRNVLLQRQRDLCLPVFPVWDDVTTFRADNPECAAYIGWLRSIRSELCISGGFPCQDISSCGKGVRHRRSKSGLWHEMARIIDEIQPAFVFAENSPMLATRGLGTVLESLAAMGYDARWCVLGADDLGYPIIRKRMWILGVRDGVNGQGYDAGRGQSSPVAQYVWSSADIARLQDADVDRLLADGLALRAPDGLAGSVEPVRAVGNGQVPASGCSRMRLLSGGLIREDNTAAMVHSGRRVIFQKHAI